jgi:drug/metabolite transporter (DMT)-like permease
MRAADWLLLVLLSVLWGASFLFIAVAVREVPPFTLVLARVSLAAIALIPFVYAFGHRLPASLRAWQPFMVQALLNNVVPFTLIAYGQARVAGALAAVLNATTPLFTLIVARIFAGEALTASKLAGVVLGIAGVAVLMGPEAVGANAAGLLGMACVLGGALSYGFSALWMRRLRAVPPMVTAAAQLTCSTIVLLPCAAVVDQFWLLPPPSTATIAAVLALAVVSTSLAYIVFFRISATAGPSNVMLVTLLIPVTATALGILVLGERLAINQIAGALVIASGLAVVDGRLIAQLTSRRGRAAITRD